MFSEAVDYADTPTEEREAFLKAIECPIRREGIYRLGEQLCRLRGIIQHCEKEGRTPWEFHVLHAPQGEFYQWQLERWTGKA